KQASELDIDLRDGSGELSALGGGQEPPLEDLNPGDRVRIVEAMQQDPAGLQPRVRNLDAVNTRLECGRLTELVRLAGLPMGKARPPVPQHDRGGRDAERHPLVESGRKPSRQAVDA